MAFFFPWAVLVFWLLFDDTIAFAGPRHATTPIAYASPASPDHAFPPLGTSYQSEQTDYDPGLSLGSVLSNETTTLSQTNYSCLSADPPDNCFEVGSSGCNSTTSFTSLAALAAAAPKLPSWCLDQYALGVLLNMLNDAIKNYTTVDDGYDAVFGYYVKYVKSITPDQVRDFVLLNDGSGGSKYFDCTFQDDESNKNITTQTCPLRPTYLEQYRYTVYYELKPGQKANYSAALSAKAGVDISWTEPGSELLQNHCERSIYPTFLDDQCIQREVGLTSQGGGNDCTQYVRSFKGYPVAKQSYTVPNPKDIVVNKVLPRLPKLRSTIEAAQTAIMTGFWNGSNDDVTQTASTAVFLFVQAVQNMAEAKAQGEAEKKAEKKAYILKVLTIVFSTLPFLAGAGEIAEPLTTFGEAIGLTGIAANTDLSIYGIVKNPGSAILQILNFLLAPADLGGVEGFAKLANLRRAMTAADVLKVGEVFKKESDSLDDIVKACVP